MASTSDVTRTVLVQTKWGLSTLPRKPSIKRISITGTETVESFAYQIHALKGAAPFLQQMFISKEIDNKLHVHSFCVMTHGKQLLSEHVTDFSKVITVIEREVVVETLARNVPPPPKAIATAPVAKTVSIRTKWDPLKSREIPSVKQISIEKGTTVEDLAEKISSLGGEPPSSQRMFICKGLANNKLHFHSFCVMKHGKHLLSKHVTDFSRMICVFKREVHVKTSAENVIHSPTPVVANPVAKTVSVLAKWRSLPFQQEPSIKSIPVGDRETVLSLATTISLIGGPPPFSQEMSFPEEPIDDQPRSHSFSVVMNMKDQLSQHVPDFSKVITVVERELHVELSTDGKSNPLIPRAQLGDIAELAHILGYGGDDDDDEIKLQSTVLHRSKRDYDAMETSEQPHLTSMTLSPRM